MTTKKRVLLSIHPEYANAILDGRKKFEFRRVIFKRPVSEIVVYATQPIGRVLGRFTIEDIFMDVPKDIWKKTAKQGGVSKEKFDDYFENRARAFAIKVGNPTRFLTPQPLSRYIASNVPPQSFCYV